MTLMNQRGFTLTELLVSLALLGMILGGVYTLQSQGLYSYLMGAAKVAVQQSARGAADMMIHELRSATSVTAIAASDLTFVDQNGATIRYNLTSGNLQRTFNGGAATVLADGVATLTFAYQDSSGTTTAVAANVATVVIGLATQQVQNPCSSSPTAQQQMVVQDQVRLRNML